MKRIALVTFIIILGLSLVGCNGTEGGFSSIMDGGGDSGGGNPGGGDPGGGDNPGGGNPGGDNPGGGAHTPEPSSLALLGLGALGILFGFKKKRG